MKIQRAPQGDEEGVEEGAARVTRRATKRAPRGDEESEEEGALKGGCDGS